MQSIQTDNRDNQNIEDQSIRTNKELYKISKYVYKEVLLDGFLASQGSQREAYIAKLEKNNRYNKQFEYFMKFISGMLIFITNIFAILLMDEFSKYSSNINELNFSWYLLSCSIIYATLFLMETMFLLMLSINLLSGFFSTENTFKWLEILPFTKKEISKIVLFSFFRSMNVQIIILLIGLPIATVLITHSIIATIVSIIISILNVMVISSILIFFNNFMGKKVSSLEMNSKKKAILRTVTMISIFGLYILCTQLWSAIPGWVYYLFELGTTTQESLYFQNLLLSFIPYPFGITNFMGLSLFWPDKIYIAQAWPTLLGFFFSTFIIYKIFQKALKILRSIAKDTEVNIIPSLNTENAEIIIETENPVKSIMRKDVKYFTKDYNQIFFLIMPIIMPIIIMFSSGLYEFQGDAQLIIVIFSNCFGLVFSGMMLLIGLMGIENDSGGLIQSLPIRQFDIYRAKRNIMTTLLSLSLIIPFVFSLVNINLPFLIVFAGFLFLPIMNLCVTDFLLILYSVFFGKLRRRYTLQQVNWEHKVLKTIISAILTMILILIPIITGSIIFGFLSQSMETTEYMLYIILAGISSVIFILIRVLAHRIFKKK